MELVLGIGNHNTALHQGIGAADNSERKRLAPTLEGELEGIVAFVKRHTVEELLEAAAQDTGRPNVHSIIPPTGSFLGASGKIHEGIGLLPTHVAAEDAAKLIPEPRKEAETDRAPHLSSFVSSSEPAICLAWIRTMTK